MICKFRKRAGGPSVGGGRQILLLSSWNIETSMVGTTSLWMGNWPRIAIKSYFEPTLHTNTVVSFIDTEWFDNSIETSKEIWLWKYFKNKIYDSLDKVKSQVQEK